MKSHPLPPRAESFHSGLFAGRRGPDRFTSGLRLARTMILVATTPRSQDALIYSLAGDTAAEARSPKLESLPYTFKSRDLWVLVTPSLGVTIGDRLSFRIVEDEKDPKPLLVADSGDLEVTRLGRNPAVGKTCKELALALKAQLEKEYYYQATVVIAVDLMTKSRGKVYLVGPVRIPGPQEIPSDEVLTLSKAILRAGGFTDFADKKNVKVTRKSAGGGDETFMVNVAEVLESGRTESDLPLKSGDLIYVPERLIRF